MKSSAYIPSQRAVSTNSPPPAAKLQRLKTQTNSVMTKDIEMIPEDSNDEEPAQDIKNINQ
jgi:hypothetical protein